MMVRGRTMLTSRPWAANAVAQLLAGELGPAVVLARGVGCVSSVTGLASGAPNTALDEVWTTFCTPAAALASSRLRVPSWFTLQNSSRSLASGTWATLW